MIRKLRTYTVEAMLRQRGYVKVPTYGGVAPEEMAELAIKIWLTGYEHHADKTRFTATGLAQHLTKLLRG